MQVLRLLFLASVQLWVSNAQAVVSVCQIMPITANNINGLIPCGYGSLTFGCVCCGGRGGNVGCLSPIETCTMGVLDYYCVKSPGYTTTSCASEGLANCGTVCMPIGGSCCPSGIQYCPAGFSCDSQNMCVENSQVPTPTTKSTTAYASTKSTTSLTTTKGNQVTVSNSGSPAGTTTAHTSTTGSVAGSVTVSSADTLPWNTM